MEKKKSRQKFREVIDKINTSYSYEVYPFDFEVLENVYETIGLKEIHDRIIVATANILRSQIITKDKEIMKLKPNSCVW